jgi:hypothetical protein
MEQSNTRRVTACSGREGKSTGKRLLPVVFIAIGDMMCFFLDEVVFGLWHQINKRFCVVFSV